MIFKLDFYLTAHLCAFSKACLHFPQGNPYFLQSWKLWLSTVNSSITAGDRKKTGIILSDISDGFRTWLLGKRRHEHQNLGGYTFQCEDITNLKRQEQQIIELTKWQWAHHGHDSLEDIEKKPETSLFWVGPKKSKQYTGPTEQI